MFKCPKCHKEIAKYEKTWKYKSFVAQFYVCSNCGAKAREYTWNGRHSFTLMFKNGYFRKV